MAAVEAPSTGLLLATAKGGRLHSSHEFPGGETPHIACRSTLDAAGAVAGCDDSARAAVATATTSTCHREFIAVVLRTSLRQLRYYRQ